MANNNDLVNFEFNHMDSEPENNILAQAYIDGYPENENAEGAVVAKVILTEKYELITVWQLNAYRLNDAVLALIDEAKYTLIEDANSRLLDGD